MSPTALQDMAGWSMTLSSKPLTTLLPMTSAVIVSIIPWFLASVLGPKLLTQSPLIAPKFQGDNFYKNRAIVEEIKKLAAKKGCNISQIALAWVAAQGMIPIPGTTKATRLENNWASRDIEFSEEEKKEMRKIIDAAKPHGNRYGPAHQAMVGHQNTEDQILEVMIWNF